MEEQQEDINNKISEAPIFLVPKMAGSTYTKPSPNISSIVKEPEAEQVKSGGFQVVKFFGFLIMGLAVVGVGAFIYLKKYQSKELTTANLDESKQIDNKVNNTDINQQSDISIGATPNKTQTIPDADWLKKYFNVTECVDTTSCGSESDPDFDGLVNSYEYKLSLDPNNPDSDTDGLADGDEVNIFGSLPDKIHSTGNTKYTDLQDIQSGYDIKTPGKKFTELRLTQVKENFKKFGIHQPSLKSLGESINLYSDKKLDVKNDNKDQSAATPAGTDTSPDALLERDIQRQTSIKKVGAALTKYKATVGNYPLTDDFKEMADMIKPYNIVATNVVDPINIDPFVYSYSTTDGGKTFTITYRSESQKLPIKYGSDKAEKDATAMEAALRDEQRIADLENIKSALLVYSSAKSAGKQSNVFPAVSKFKSELVPQYLTTLPKDPQSGADYSYQVSATFDSFTLKTTLENPDVGTTGYLCNQEECRTY